MKDEPKDLTPWQALAVTIVLLFILLLMAEASKNVPYWQW